MAKFIFSASFVGCVFFLVSAKQLDPEQLSKLHDEAAFAHRQDLAKGIAGLPPLDPLSLGPFEISAYEVSLLSTTIKGLTTFDKFHNDFHQNGSFATEIHIPHVKFAGEFLCKHPVLGVTSGNVSATINDIYITISGVKKHVVSDVSFDLNIKGKPSNIKLEGENIGLEYQNFVGDLLEIQLNSLLMDASQEYETDIVNAVTYQINTLDQYKQQ